MGSSSGRAGLLGDASLVGTGSLELGETGEACLTGMAAGGTTFFPGSGGGGGGAVGLWLRRVSWILFLSRAVFW